MSNEYEALEGNREEGEPVELFHLTMGATNWYLTSGDVPLNFGGNIYTPDAISAEAQRMSGEDDDEGVVLVLPRLHAIAQLFQVGMPAEPMAARIVLSHRSILGTGSGTDTEHQPFTGQVESASTDGDKVRLLCLPTTSLLRRQTPSHEVSVSCYNTLYDSLCGVLRADFAVTGSVTAIASDRKTITVDISPASFGIGYFIGGWMTQLSSGRRQAIATNSTGGSAPVMQLLAPIKGLQVGDAVEVLPGCRHDEVDCEAKFANGLRFGGFARIPSRDPFKSGVQ